MKSKSIWPASWVAIVAVGIAGVAIETATAEMPSAGAANTIKYRLADPLPGNATLTMYVRSKETATGKVVPKYVDKMVVTGVLLSCDEGYASYGWSTGDDMKIDRAGEFSYSFSQFTASFVGTVSKGGKKSEGTISFGPGNAVVDDIVGDSYTNCSIDGGPIPYSARYV